MGGQTIAPRRLSRFWLRRLAEGIVLVCGLIVILYALNRFVAVEDNFSAAAYVDDAAAIAALISGIFAATISLWTPTKRAPIYGVVLFLAFSASISILIYTSGGLSSPLAALWIIPALFASVFGVIVTTAMAAAAAAIFIHPSGGEMNIIDTTSALLFALLPLVLSLVIWHRQPSKKRNDAYSDLAHKLSSVEGKSDIVINTIDDGVLAIARSGNIELINPAAQRLIGWEQGDALGLNWQSVLRLASLDGKEVPDIDNPVIQSLEENKPSHTDKLMVLTSSGKPVLASVATSPVGQTGEGVIVVFRDITKEKAEEREQAEFISTASHEMRTPVASIEGYLGLALNPATATIDEKARDYINKAHDSAGHLGRLFQDLLDISKSEDGILKNEPKVIDVSSFVGDIFQGLSHQAAEKQLRYIFKPNPSLESSSDSERVLRPVYYAYVDPDHFREVVANLIENAIKYTPTGEVVADVEGDEKTVSISVQDSGIGIPTEDQSHLFQKFYRVDNSDTREIGGTGLGLYLSRRLAETMSGRLRVESEYKKGSKFFLEVPRIPHEQAMQKLSEAADQKAAEPTIVGPSVATMAPTALELNQAPSPVALPAVPVVSQPPAVLQTQPLNPQPQPTLAEIEHRIEAERAQLSVPHRNQT